MQAEGGGLQAETAPMKHSSVVLTRIVMIQVQLIFSCRSSLFPFVWAVSLRSVAAYVMAAIWSSGVSLFHLVGVSLSTKQLKDMAQNSICSH